MKSLVLLLLVISIVMMAIGYQKSLHEKMETRTVVEYRFIPRSLYEEQIQPVNLQQSFKDMFDKEDVYLSRV